MSDGVIRRRSDRVIRQRSAPVTRPRSERRVLHLSMLFAGFVDGGCSRCQFGPAALEVLR
jgi:hypothetical protein